MIQREYRHDGVAILSKLANQLGVAGTVRYGYMGGGGERVFYLSGGPLEAPCYLGDSVVSSALTLHRLRAEQPGVATDGEEKS